MSCAEVLDLTANLTLEAELMVPQVPARPPLAALPRSHASIRQRSVSVNKFTKLFSRVRSCADNLRTVASTVSCSYIYFQSF